MIEKGLEHRAAKQTTEFQTYKTKLRAGVRTEKRRWRPPGEDRKSLRQYAWSGKWGRIKHEGRRPLLEDVYDSIASQGHILHRSASEGDAVEKRRRRLIGAKSSAGCRPTCESRSMPFALHAFEPTKTLQM
jgi:hypothetical protein